MTLERWLTSNRPDDFEEGITYLFSLQGFNAIHVGSDFEKVSLINRRNKYIKSATSIDVLAIFDNIIIICQCSTDLNHKKITELTDITEEIKNLLNTINSYQIVPIIASTVSQSTIHGTIEEAHRKGIKVLTKEGIQKLLNNVKKGESITPLQVFDYLI